MIRLIPQKDRLFWLAAVALSIVLLAAHLVSLREFPILRSVDEPSLLSFANQILKDGRIESPMFAGMWQTQARAGRAYYLMTAWLSVFGVDWMAGRAFFLAVGAITLVLIFFAGRSMFGAKAGMIGALFAASTLIFFVTAHHMRLDIVLACAVALLAWVYHRADTTQRAAWHFLTGFLVVFSYEAHPNAITFMAAFGAYYVLRYARPLLRRQTITPLAMIGGVAVGAMVFAALHILPSVEAFRAGANFTMEERGIPLLSGESLPEMLRQYLAAGWTDHVADVPFEAILGVGLVCAGLIVRRTRPLAVIYGLSQAAAVLLLGIYRPVYYVDGLPLLALIAGGLLSVPLAIRLTRVRWVIALALYAGLIVSTSRVVIPTVRQAWNSRIIARIETLRDVVPAGTPVIGSPMLIFAFGVNADIYDPETLSLAIEQTSLDAVLARTHAVYFIDFHDESPPIHLHEYGWIWSPMPTGLADRLLLESTLPGVNGTMDIYRIGSNIVPYSAAGAFIGLWMVGNR